MNIVLLHYYAGKVGGVEQVMEKHAELFAAHGHRVTLVSGSAISARDGIEFRQIEELDPANASEASSGAVERMKRLLVPVLQGAEVVILHNVLTMPFHPALMAALWELAGEMSAVRFIAWVHDLDSSVSMRAQNGIEYVAVSGERGRRLLAAGARCRVIPNGVEPNELLALTPNVARLADDYSLLEADLVLLHPTRLLRRKNIELGLRVLAELKRRELRCYYIVTAATDAYRTSAGEYSAELNRLRDERGVRDEALFVQERFAVTKRDLASLYAVSDALFFPSKSEGFGIPLLEAALHRLPVFCMDLEPMKSVAPLHATRFDPGIAPERLADLLAQAAHAPSLRSRKRVTREFGWDAIYERCLAPLLRG